MPGTATPKRAVTPRPAPKAQLSRERIALTALRLADAEGLDALSMRRLATELDVGTMTLYGYFRSKEELTAAMVDVATANAPIRVADGHWRDQLRALMLGIRRTLAEHPSFVQLRLTRPILTPGALRASDAGLRILDRAGFDKAEAARAYRALFLYTFGHAGFGSPPDPEQTRRHAKAVALALPEREYPALSAAATEVSEVMAGDEPFEWGLDRFLDGLEALLSRRGRA
jgi:AcrR family transcriptional regulator